jgi:outer membrane immunogenic protein
MILFRRKGGCAISGPHRVRPHSRRTWLQHMRRALGLTAAVAAAAWPFAAAADDVRAPVVKAPQSIARRPIKPVPPPAPPPVEPDAKKLASNPPSWTGLYAGGTLAVPFLNSNETADTVGSSFGQSLAQQTFAPSAYAGINWQAQTLLFGLEGDIERGFPGTQQAAKSAIDPSGRQTFSIRDDFRSSLRLRVGYPTDRFMFYVAAGAAIGNWTISHVYPSLSAQDSSSSVQLGWTAGVGLEYALSPQWSSRLEYRYTDFGTFAVSSSYAPAVSYRERLNESSIRVGLGYRF